MSPLPNFQGGCRALFLNGGCRALFLDGGLQGTLFRWGVTGHSFPGTSLKVLRYCQPPPPSQNLVGAQPPFPPCRKGIGGSCFCIRNEQKSEIFILGVHWKICFLRVGGHSWKTNIWEELPEKGGRHLGSSRFKGGGGLEKKRGQYCWGGGGLIPQCTLCYLVIKSSLSFHLFLIPVNSKFAKLFIYRTSMNLPLADLRKR